MQTTLPYSINDIDIINKWKEKIFENIQKAKVYVKNPQDDPKDVLSEK